MPNEHRPGRDAGKGALEEGWTKLCIAGATRVVRLAGPGENAHVSFSPLIREGFAVVSIRDHNAPGAPSVTNAAEEVVAWIWANNLERSGLRPEQVSWYYRDSRQRWDEIVPSFDHQIPRGVCAVTFRPVVGLIQPDTGPVEAIEQRLARASGLRSLRDVDFFIERT